ncbi:hypothetical protein [Marinobacter halophilus]|uniref:Lipoprotein n=1 Tax=Marinobacter halophilus TaxID=1323740 RepID=A0A2T1KEL8_9GAMM|nr:hypothetical protein [Marinobacter halophilus]PSF08576.1 hypothetical protein C7H08_07810 [Marinobacter halophilus]GGC61867.1 hypothetical protein GCM10011362_07880 [Marinobacter halophilus]
MKKVLIASGLVLAGALSGCSSLNTSAPSLPLTGGVTTDIKADIEIGEKITGKSSVTQLFGLLTLGAESEYADGISYGVNGTASSFLPIGGASLTEKVKAAAAYNAITESGADVIVAPRYTVKEEGYGFFGTIDVTVEGYKGTIKSIK